MSDALLRSLVKSEMCGYATLRFTRHVLLRTCLRSVARGRQRGGAQKPQFTRVNEDFEQRIRPDHGIAVRS